jgi:hypothetical protein
MTATIGSEAIDKVVTKLGARFAPEQVHAENVAAELAEKTAGAWYPGLYVYCDRVINDQVEKFRTFSGRVRVGIDVRHSQDRLEGLADSMELLVDAVGDVLATNRGDWLDGMFYGGKYEVSLGPVKHGGKNFIQTAKVTFEIGVSKD